MLGAFTVSVSPFKQQLSESRRHLFLSPEIAARTDAEERHIRIADLVARQVIPKLILDHKFSSRAEPCLEPSAEDVCTLVQLVLGADAAAAHDHIGLLRTQGLTTDVLFLDLLQPAARYLGEMWERDECDFIDVTLGVGRLQSLLAAADELAQTDQPHGRRGVYLSVTPGDQHFFGVSMVERFLRAGGWNVHVEKAERVTVDHLRAAVSDRWFAIAGLSSASEVHLDVLAHAIREIRQSSCNPKIGIMVGGPIFTRNPELAETVGADVTAVNGPAAVVAAQRLSEAAGG